MGPGIVSEPQCKHQMHLSEMLVIRKKLANGGYIVPCACPQGPDDSHESWQSLDGRVQDLQSCPRASRGRHRGFPLFGSLCRPSALTCITQQHLGFGLRLPASSHACHRGLGDERRTHTYKENGCCLHSFMLNIKYGYRYGRSRLSVL